MSNNLIKEAISGFFPQALIEYPNKKSEIRSKIAFGFLLAIFLFIGIGIAYSALQKKDPRIEFIVIGILCCAAPFLLYLLLSKTKARMIVKLDKEGIVVRSGKFYAWDDLQSITYHMAMKRYAYNSPNQCYLIDFYFKSGTARAGFLMQHFSTILFISNALPVPKKEKVNAYRR